MSHLHPGDNICIRSKKNNDNHEHCVFKVKSISAAGYVSFDLFKINGKQVKRADKGLKPSGGYDADFFFFHSDESSENVKATFFYGIDLA